MEMEEENIVNRLQRQLRGLVSSYKNMQAKLEAKGISLRDVGVQPINLHSEYARAPPLALSVLQHLYTPTETVLVFPACNGCFTCV